MKTNCVSLVTALALLATPSFLAAADQDPLGRSFSREGSGWVQHDPNGRSYAVDPEVITVKFAGDATRAAQDQLHARLGTHEMRRASTGFVDIRLGRGQDVMAVLDAYRQSGMVEIAEPNTIGTYTLVPNDTSYGSLWWHPIVSTPTAWDSETGDPSVIVAVLDSGTEFTHSDLGLGSDGYQNVWENAGEDAWADPTNPNTGNGIDDDGNGFVDDWKGYDFSSGNNNSGGVFFHGTAVAGVTAAKTNNGLGVAGVAGGFGGPGARVMIAGVGDNFPNGAAIDDAVLYAADNGARVVQLSLTVGASAAIDAAFQSAVNSVDMLIVCAAGNAGSSSVAYPSSNPNVIAVGASDESDSKASFSNFGTALEVAAPGTSIFALDLGNSYGTTSGTSFSAPLVSGVIALMLSSNPALTGAEVRQALHDTADKVGGYDYNWNAGMPGHSREMGYGRVNAAAAVAAAGGGGGGIPCADVDRFQARCVQRGQGNLMQMRVVFTDNSHDGETVVFGVDGANQSVVISGDRARLQIPGAASGAHVLSLEDPASCVAPQTVTCP